MTKNPSKLTVRQKLILAYLHSKGGIVRKTEIMSFLAIIPRTCERSMSRLVRLGYVKQLTGQQYSFHPATFIITGMGLVQVRRKS